MELNFVQSGQFIGKKPAYEAEFEVTSDFNIHIERVNGGRFSVYQKTSASGKYDLVDGAGHLDYKDVIDMDMTALVYPKYIKIISDVQPTIAVVTFA